MKFNIRLTYYLNNGAKIMDRLTMPAKSTTEQARKLYKKIKSDCREYIGKGRAGSISFGSIIVDISQVCGVRVNVYYGDTDVTYMFQTKNHI